MIKNKCDRCGRLTVSQRSKYMDGKVKWLCDFCFKIENEPKPKKKK